MTWNGDQYGGGCDGSGEYQNLRLCTCGLDAYLETGGAAKYASWNDILLFPKQYQLSLLVKAEEEVVCRKAQSVQMEFEVVGRSESTANEVVGLLGGRQSADF